MSPPAPTINRQRASRGPADRAQPDAARGRAVTRRTVALALLLAVVVPLVGVNTVSIYASGDPGNRAVSYFAVSVLLLLALLNRLWRRVRPGWALAPAELVTLYFATALCASFCSFESLFMLAGGMLYPFRFASGANHWGELFLERLPR
jgi:uncharacterized membrane protein